MHRHRLALLVVLPLALVAGGSTTAAASPPAAELRDVTVLEDRAGTETIETVAAAAPGRFRPLPGGNLSAGYSRSAYWLRFTVEAPPGEWWLEVQPPYLDDLRLFEPDPARPGHFRERRAGDRLPFAAREVPHRGFVFKLPIAAGAPAEYYLRVKTTSSAMVLLRIWSPEAFHAAMPGEYGLLFALIAMLLVVAGLNLSSWLWTRERTHLAFFGYLSCMAAVFIGASGFAAQYLLPDRPQVTDPWVGVATLLSFAAFAVWYQEILNISARQPFLDGLGRVLAVVAVVGLAAIPLGVYGEVAQVVNLLTLALIGSGLFVTYRMWRRGLAGSGLQLLVTALSLLAFASTLLTLLGFVRSHFLHLYGPAFGVAASMVTLQLAMSAHHRSLRDERQRAEGEARREREIREQQGKFIDLVTHEYRTPLAVLRTNLDILGLTGEEDERRRSLGRMEGAVRRLGEIFDGSLRQGNWGGHRQIALESLDPVALVRELVGQSADPATGIAQPVEMRVREPVRVQADRQLLATVFLNLLDNARKYSPAGSPLEIRFGQEDGLETIRFENGCARSPGVSTEVLARKYVRGDNAEGVPGMGVGLHLVRKLLEDQGGALELRADEGERFVAIVKLARGREGDAA